MCVWSPNENDETEEESRAQRRLAFEANMKTEGLHLEREVVKDDLHFVKVIGTRQFPNSKILIFFF